MPLTRSLSCSRRQVIYSSGSLLGLCVFQQAWHYTAWPSRATAMAPSVEQPVDSHTPVGELRSASFRFLRARSCALLASHQRLGHSTTGLLEWRQIPQPPPPHSITTPHPEPSEKDGSELVPQRAKIPRKTRSTCVPETHWGSRSGRV